MEIIGIFLLIIVIVFIAKGAAKATQEADLEAESKRNQAELTKRFGEIQAKGFSPSDPIVAFAGRWAFSTDERNRKIFLVAPGETQVLDYGNVIQVSLLSEEGVVYEKSTARVIGGAALGGFFFGNAGAALGAYTAPTKQRRYHSSITIKVLLRGCSVPSITLPCFDAASMGKKDGMDGSDPLYQRFASNAERILDTLNVIIDGVKRSERASLPRQDAPQGLLSSELEKLASMRERGLLTEGEFAAAKARLLKGSDDRRGEIE